MTTEQGVLLHITIFIKTERAAEFFEHFKPAYDAVIAEPECTLFEVSIDSNTEPGITRIRFLEGWAASENWLMTVQIAKEYYQPYVAATESMMVRPRVVELHEYVPEWSYRRGEPLQGA